MADSIEKGLKAGVSPAGLEAIVGAARDAGKRGLPPVHLWNPPYCGDIGMKITRDGAWHYAGTPIGRPALVRLFSTILRKDPDRYVLVTPVEKIAIDVEDAPFLAVEMTLEGDGLARVIRFRTNVDDWVTVDAQHPLRFEQGPSGGVKPYVLIRADLWALATRPILHDLVEIGEVRDVDGRASFGIASAGQFFVICAAGDIEGFA
jgi:uncharacterized protein